MPKRMLIDSSHPEETRVVVLDGQRVEEFDFEAASKRPLKGNIYLAKVTRVEPSLQAAFVEYGGNRQGFLAFSEIHPDYYQIPVADRMALLADQEAEARERQEDDIESFDIKAKPEGSAEGESEEDEDEETSEEASDESGEETAEETSGEETGGDPEPAPTAKAVPVVAAPEGDAAEEHDDDDAEETSGQESAEAAAAGQSGETNEAEPVPEGEERRSPQQDAMAQEAKRPSQRWMRRRHYKIQEVIKRRQIILVQVVKEERGNKGAALTTYLSLAGRYCVLMPNTPRGGGISRKITNANDRKRLKAAAQSLELPEGMGLIIRTAGENRTKLEIKRDYEYLLRLWDTIRDITLRSNAPACVYEEGDLIKRAIRDLYNKDVSDVVVEGEDGYHNAKDFMRMLMPSHAKNVKPYKEPVPLFQRHHIEAQLDAMFSPTVTLKSGGYIVINQTEALVAIDVNSGRATREHNIEDTATKTNLEAADEIGRQLRLRDLAGLIVIDFIDMEDSRNDRAVEKRLHNAVKNDRARIQIGKISQFGLLEMSRQRLRAGVIAGSTVPCPHCGGQGIVRSVESTALRVLRGLEEEAQKQRCEGMIVNVASDVGFYTLNQKRPELTRLETEYDVVINFEPKEGLKVGDFEIERIGTRDPSTRPRLAAFEPPPEIEPEIEEEDEIEAAEEAGNDPAEMTPTETAPEARSEGREGARDGGKDGARDGDGGRRRKRRRRRGGRGRDGQENFESGDAPRTAAEGTAPESNQAGLFDKEAVDGEEGEDFGPDEAEGAESTGNESTGGVRSEGQNGQTGEGQNGDGLNGEGRRRRRRRRGRRGGRDREGFSEPRGTEDGIAPVAQTVAQPVIQQPVPAAPRPVMPTITPASFYEDRFGNVDEIDTTPQEEPRALPNAASTPVWSLEPEQKPEPVKAAPVAVVPAAPTPVAVAPAIEQQPVSDGQDKHTEAPKAETPKTEAVEEPVKAEPAKAEPVSTEPPAPPKKGWWQRTFRPE